ncbi:hypothetical protein GCM10023187_57440 [Nibrella viscosa]|uniref:Uncharacterized protein n=1 Tax=Nibrella viscosa TaxID=1084524 RepID=A0ABP8L3F9_9BACT
MTLAANVLAIENENRKIEEVKKAAVRKLLLQGKLTVGEIADANDVTVDIVLDIQRNLSTDK